MRPKVSLASGFLFACLLAAAGCTSNLHSIEGRIFFNVAEDYINGYSEGMPRILLEMRTEKIYGCGNNRIISEIIRSGRFITINMKGILFPEICMFALGPATSRDFLDLPEGVYSLNFLQWSSPDRYTLTVRKDAIEVVPGLTTYTAPEYTVFWRYPENSFAYYCGTMTETARICDDFLAQLLSEIDLEEFRFPDYGETCYPPSGRGHYYDAPPRYFKYRKEEDFDLAGELLKAYAERMITPNQGTTLWIVNWKNKQYSGG
jgi:hypothetical protein